MQGGKRKSPAKSPSKKTTKSVRKVKSSKGGAVTSDLQALAVPFALAVLQRGVQYHNKKDKHARKSISGGDNEPSMNNSMDGGAKKRRSTPKKHSKAKVAEIKKEFMSITDAISNFLKKY